MDNFHELISLDKNVPIPLYYQLKSQMLSLIEKGIVTEGDMIPPENEFCDMLSISRPTVRQAFNELVSEGYIHRFKGRGTFVAKRKVAAHFLSDLDTFNNEMLAKGLTPRTELLALKIRSDYPKANEHLNISPYSPLIYLNRRRFANNVPIVLVETYLSYEAYPKLLNVDLANKSFYESMEELYGVRIAHVKREIEAVNALKKEAELLEIATNKAVTLVKTFGYTDGLPNPVEYSVAKYSGEMNKFHVELRR